MRFTVHSLRIEKTMTYNNRNCEYESNEIYVLNCISDTRKKYELRLWTIYGDCYSGWCEASWGYGDIRMVDSFVGMTHKPILKLEFELDIHMDTKKMELTETINNKIFSITYDGGDFYYASGGASVNINLFEETNRNQNKRPVWIFKGDSALGKSYLAGIIANSDRMKTVYETDAHESLDNIHEDIVVIGNKYPYSVEEIKKYIEGEYEVILVDFSKMS